MRLKFPELICRAGSPAFGNYSNRQLESNFRLLKRKILLTDTAHEHYSVIIFPADTFGFSAQHGFKGKAEKIELSGKLRRVINRTDSAGLLEERLRVMNYGEQYEIKKAEVSNSRVLEKKRLKVVIVLIMVVVILVGWCLWDTY